jgi:hypothetical protein
MNRIARYHRNHDMLAAAIAAAGTIACLAFDVYVVAAWLAL